MNLQFAVSVGMACTWLVAGVYLLIAYPQLRSPFGDDPRIGAGWLAVGLLIVWNSVRAYVTWKPTRPREGADDPGY